MRLWATTLTQATWLLAVFRPSSAVMPCPATSAVMPFLGAGDPAAGSPFAGYQVETLTPTTWFTYYLGAIVLQRCLVSATIDHTTGYHIVDFGVSTSDSIAFCSLCYLLTDKKQLWYNTTEYGGKYCPTIVDSSTRPALSFGSIQPQTACPTPVPGAQDPIPPILQMPYQYYTEGQLAQFPSGADFIISGYEFIIQMTPHFVLHFCARQATPQMYGGIQAYQLLAGKDFFDVACIIMARINMTLVFTQPSFTTTLKPADCPVDMSDNYTLPDFYVPKPSFTSSPSVSPSHTLTASRTPHPTVSSSFSPTYEPPPPPSPAPGTPGVVIDFTVQFAGVAQAYLSAPAVLAALALDLAALDPAANATAADVVLDGTGGAAAAAMVGGGGGVVGFVPAQLFLAAPPLAAWTATAQAALLQQASAVSAVLLAKLPLAASSPSPGAAAGASSSGQPPTASVLPRTLAALQAAGAFGPLVSANATAAAAAFNAAVTAGSVQLVAALLPAPPAPPASPLPMIAGGAIVALLLLGGAGAYCCRRRLADALGLSKKTKLRAHMRSLRDRAVALNMKRQSYIAALADRGGNSAAAAAKAKVEAANALERERAEKERKAAAAASAGGESKEGGAVPAVPAEAAAAAVDAAVDGGSGDAKKAGQADVDAAASADGKAGRPSSKSLQRGASSSAPAPSPGGVSKNPLVAAGPSMNPMREAAAAAAAAGQGGGGGDKAPQAAAPKLPAAAPTALNLGAPSSSAAAAAAAALALAGKPAARAATNPRGRVEGVDGEEGGGDGPSTALAADTAAKGKGLDGGARMAWAPTVSKNKALATTRAGGRTGRRPAGRAAPKVLAATADAEEAAGGGLGAADAELQSFADLEEPVPGAPLPLHLGRGGATHRAVLLEDDEIGGGRGGRGYGADDFGALGAGGGRDRVGYGGVRAMGCAGALPTSVWDVAQDAADFLGAQPRTPSPPVPIGGGGGGTLALDAAASDVAAEPGSEAAAFLATRRRKSALPRASRVFVLSGGAAGIAPGRPGASFYGGAMLLHPTAPLQPLVGSGGCSSRAVSPAASPVFPESSPSPAWG